MNQKSRLALLFTALVSIVLFISSCTIYFLYYTNRESQFYQREKSEGLLFQAQVNHLKTPDEIAEKLFYSVLHNSTIFDQHIIILDSAGNVVRKVPDSLHYSVNKKILAKIRSEKEYFWYGDNNYQYAGMVIKGTNQILISAGLDKYGFKKLTNLLFILVFVFAGGIFFTALISFIFVQQAFRPLTKLSMQMNQITFQNLSHRIESGRSNDEISDIARNFNNMLERLGHAFEFQKSFVYHASHELRTPLATMLSQTESALAKTLTEADYKKVLLSLKEDQQEMIELTNSLLVISQFDQMGQVKDWPRLRIDEVLYESMSMAKRMFPSLTVHLSFGTMPERDDDFVVNGNESLLKSVFANLIKNAFYYSIDQKVAITLESHGPTIFVHFDNTGMQLPADEKENIMTPFFRGGNALKTKGYGLGLAIVYRFITIHKGTVTYTPIANDVNRFTITLNKAPIPDAGA